MKRLIFFGIALFIGIALFSQNSDIRAKHFNLKNSLAIGGYDPVAYFKQGKAIKGITTIAVKYSGILYYFSTQANKDLFIKNSLAYEPQYGGWCAYAMGNSGEKVEIDPETFKILNGKLYLFYNAYFNNTLKSWNKDESGLKTKADNNWQALIKK